MGINLGSVQTTVKCCWFKKKSTLCRLEHCGLYADDPYSNLLTCVWYDGNRWFVDDTIFKCSGFFYSGGWGGGGWIVSCVFLRTFPTSIGSTVGYHEYGFLHNLTNLFQVCRLFRDGAEYLIYNCFANIPTGYGPDGPGIESRWRRDFSHPFRPAPRPIQVIPGQVLLTTHHHIAPRLKKE
jgi:hypothetical protein